MSPAVVASSTHPVASGARAAGTSLAVVALAGTAAFAAALIPEAPLPGAAALAATLLLAVAVLGARRSSDPVALIGWTLIALAALPLVLAALASGPGGAEDFSRLAFVLPQFALLFLPSPVRTPLAAVIWRVALLGLALGAVALAALAVGSSRPLSVAVPLVGAAIVLARPAAALLVRGTADEPGQNRSLDLLAGIVVEHLAALGRLGSGLLPDAVRGRLDADLRRLLGDDWAGARGDAGTGARRGAPVRGFAMRLAPLDVAGELREAGHRIAVVGVLVAVVIAAVTTVAHAGEIDRPLVAALALVLVVAAGATALHAQRLAATGTAGLQCLWAATLLGVVAGIAEFASTMGRDVRTYDDFGPIVVGVLLVALAPAFSPLALAACGAVTAVAQVILSVGEVGVGLRDTPLVLCIVAALVPIGALTAAAVAFSRACVDGALVAHRTTAAALLAGADGPRERALNRGVAVLAAAVRADALDRAAVDRARDAAADLAESARSQPPHPRSGDADERVEPATDGADGPGAPAERG